MNLQGEGGLFSPNLVQGDLSTIAPVVRVVQTLSVWAISLIGLMITISTVLKQGLHGLYATNPKFWDKVDEVHMANMATLAGDIKQGNQISASIGFVFNLFLGFLPNVKKMTEFDDYNTDPKTFFTKSLPIACLYLFIGVFIFYGYTTKFGAYVSEFGTEVMDAFFLSVDPIELASKVPSSIAKRVKVPSDSAKDDFSQSVNGAYKQVYRAVNTLLKDIDSSRNQDIALAVEAWCSQCLQEVISETNKGQFNQTFRATLVPNALDLSSVQGSSAKGVTMHAWQTPLSTFNTGSAMPQAETYYVVLEFESTKKGAEKETSTFECTMTGGEYVVGSGTKASLDLGALPSQGQLTQVSSTVNGIMNGDSVTLKVSGSKIEINGKKEVLNGASEISSISGLSYSINGEGNKITRIVFDSSKKGSSIVFSANNGGTKGDWKFGEAPQMATAEDDQASGNNNNSNDGNNSGGNNSGNQSGGNNSDDNDDDDGDDGDLFN